MGKPRVAKRTIPARPGNPRLYGGKGGLHLRRLMALGEEMLDVIDELYCPLRTMEVYAQEAVRTNDAIAAAVVLKRALHIGAKLARPRRALLSLLTTHEDRRGQLVMDLPPAA